MNISSHTIKTLISIGDIETLDLLKEVEMHEILKKIAFTRPLSAEEIYKLHGRDVVLIYISICNGHDENKINEDLWSYLVKIK